MNKISKTIVKLRVPILIVSLLLMIPSLLGMAATRVNYDLLSYLPKDIDTMVGQDIVKDEFGKGAFSLFMVDGMDIKDTVALKEKIEAVDGVEEVIWYDTAADISIPMELIPQKYYDAFNSENSTLMAIFFTDGTSADKTLGAIEEIRSIAGKQCFLSGMSAVILDTRDLTQRETPIYVVIAVLLSAVVMALFLDSFMLPVIFLADIGIAVMYNMGTNYFLGEISFVTQAISAVLQLGVTLDYSIFLWHSYKAHTESGAGREEAMSEAISETFISVIGSSVTTVAGFIALCFMSFTLGLDLGIVMAKGVILGVIACVTILPSLILIFDKAIEKTSHRPLMPDFTKLSSFIANHSWIFAVVFLAMIPPAVYGYTHSEVYYNLDKTLPRDLPGIVANQKLSDEYNMSTAEIILVDSDMSAKDSGSMISEIKNVDGVKLAVGYDSVFGAAIPDEMIPDEAKEALKSKDHQMILVTSDLTVATDEMNRQIDEVTAIVKKYDSNGMVIGEAPCTKDLIDVTAVDFRTVSIVSIAAIFVIIFFVFKSFSLPVILVSVIEFAIFINMGIPTYTGTVIPFVASVVIGTIQLGSTVDYAILMTTRYKRERLDGADKRSAVLTALSSSINSVVVSALGFFAATFGVGLYSNVDMISSLCTLMARGALISMIVVIFVLPSMLMIFDRLICTFTIGMGKVIRKRERDSGNMKNVPVNANIGK
ncbi:MAG: MMPL family transporter [Oscillospiraceae bacterium]|nr:MMPL family transporter [Oscillospiraceae bacterium]